jgi:hypothetical protein
MKKGLKYFAIILVVLSICSANVKAATINGYTYKKISVSGKYSDTSDKDSYKKIIKSYKDLVKLEKYINKNYNNPKKYLKKLNKYTKSYFKKNSLVFVTENVDVNFIKYKLSSVTIDNNKLKLTINRIDTLKSGCGKTDVVIYEANTYIIEAKKSKLKNVEKVKVKYDFIKNS